MASWVISKTGEMGVYDITSVQCGSGVEANDGGILNGLMACTLGCVQDNGGMGGRGMAPLVGSTDRVCLLGEHSPEYQETDSSVEVRTGLSICGYLERFPGIVEVDTVAYKFFIAFPSCSVPT